MVCEIYLNKLPPPPQKKDYREWVDQSSLAREKPRPDRQLRAIIPKVCKYLKLKENEERPTFVKYLICTNHVQKPLHTEF